MATSTPVGSANTSYRFSMPGCGVTVSSAATNKILDVAVKGADLDNLTSVEDIATNKTSNLVIPENHAWGYYFNITDNNGKYHGLTDAATISGTANDNPIWMSVDTQLAGIDWSKQTTDVTPVDYVDVYTVNVNYFLADFRIPAGSGIKCEGATVAIEGKDAAEFAKWNNNKGFDYVLRGTTLVVTPGVTGNSFIINGKAIESGDDPMKITMGKVSAIEIRKDESTPPVPSVGDATLTLDKTTSTIAALGSDTLTATFNPGSTGLTATYAWASSDIGIASITNSTAVSETVSHVAPGTATVTVTATLSNGATLTATCNVTCAVPSAGDATLTLNNTTLSLSSGTGSLAATFTANTSGRSVTSWAWANTNDDAATISGSTSSSETVTFVAVGDTTVTVTATLDNGATLSARCAVTCAPSAGNATLSLTPLALDSGANNTKTVTATFTPGASGLTVTKYEWESDDTTVATVVNADTGTTNTNTVRYVGKGSAVVTVTATLSNGAKLTGTCAVTCTVDAGGASLRVSPAAVTLAADGNDRELKAYLDNGGDSTLTVTKWVWSVDDESEATVLNTGSDTTLVTNETGGNGNATVIVTVTATLSSGAEVEGTCTVTCTA